jgi:zeta-carotene desaturase
LAVGLLFSNAFPFPEKIALSHALSAFSKKPFALDPAIETVAQYLDATRQGPRARERFWIPVSNAVMNVPPGEAPLVGFGEVLHRVFFGRRRDGALAVASRPLSEVAFPQVLPFLERSGSKVHFHEGVQSFQVDGKSFQLTTRSGKTWTGDGLVWAVPPSSLASLWPSGARPSREDFPKLGKSPILSVHLILSSPVLEGHFAGLPGARFDWVFNRNANWDWKGEGQYLSFTAGAAEDLAREPEADLVRLAFRELQDRCPRARNAKILNSKVTREMAATFFWNKASGKFRPAPETSLPNVFLAGDWTDTGLPATIEGACLSGHRAAKKIQELLSQTFQ